MSTPREPLTPEERELAQHLLRASSSHEPGPALDARILAMAQAAVDNTGATSALPPGAPVPPAPAPAPAGAAPIGHATRRPRRSWSVGLGVAASLVVAVTIAWQLRPQQTTSRIYESAEAPTGASAASAPVTEQAAADVAPAPSPAPAKDRPAQPEGPPALEPRTLAPPPPPKPAPVAAQQEVLDRKVAVAAEVERPVDHYAPPAPPAPVAPPPPPAPVSAASEPALARAEAVEILRRRSAAREAANTAAPAAVQRLKSAGAADSGFNAAAEGASVPPPMAAAPAPSADIASSREDRVVIGDRALPPEQWLQRIRKYRFEGDSALARASLQAFQRAHPDLAIPDDLQPLLP